MRGNAIILSIGLVSTAAVMPPAIAGEIADAARAAEEALATDGDDAWAAFDRAVELFWAEAPLSFRRAVLVDDVAGFGDFVIRAGARYRAGDAVHVYLEPVGYGWTPIGDLFRVRFAVDVEIVAEDRGVIAAEQDFALVERVGPTRSRELEVTMTMALPGLPPGRYELRLGFRDAATGKAATASVGFEVVE